MTSKQARREDNTPKNVSMTPRCLAIVLKEKRNKKLDDADYKHGNTHGTDWNNGRVVFASLQNENRNCYWNHSLEESIRKMRYLGYVQPSTLLLGGKDVYLDTLRAAWAKRLLKPPKNFSIVRMGEVNSIDMQVIPQTQFIPLPEALCVIIQELNNAGLWATLDAIQEKLGHYYKGMHRPSGQIIYETLGTLIKERKLYHTGNGYYLVTPDMYHHPQGTLPLQGDRPFIVDEGGMGVTMYIPVTHFQRPDFAQTMQQQQQQQQQQQHPHPHPHHQRPGMATIACQTNHYGERTDRIDPNKIDPKEAQMHLAKFQRSQSMRIPKSRDPRSSRISDKVSDSNFSRSTSLRYEEEKAQQVVKDINLKTSEVHQEKDKGEKTSLLSKLFGRNKKKVGGSESSSSNGEGPEYATFSAQFPPPEWEWYQAHEQGLRQGVPKTQTWHHFGSIPQEAEEIAYEKPRSRGRKSKTMPMGFTDDQGFQAGQTMLPVYTETERLRLADRGHVRHHSLERERHVDDHLEEDWYSDSVNSESENYYEAAPHCGHRHRSGHGNRRHGNDIHIEYQGRLPNKESMIGMSRDSGVNCVGLDNQQKQKAKRTAANHMLNNDLHLGNQGRHSKTISSANQEGNAVTNSTNEKDSPRLVVGEKSKPDTSSSSYGDSGICSPHATDVSDNKYSSLSTNDGTDLEQNPARGYLDMARRGQHRLSDISDVSGMERNDSIPGCSLEEVKEENLDSCERYPAYMEDFQANTIPTLAMPEEDDIPSQSDNELAENCAPQPSVVRPNVVQAAVEVHAQNESRQSSSERSKNMSLERRIRDHKREKSRDPSATRGGRNKESSLQREPPLQQEPVSENISKRKQNEQSPKKDKKNRETSPDKKNRDKSTDKKNREKSPDKKTKKEKDKHREKSPDKKNNKKEKESKDGSHKNDGKENSKVPSKGLKNNQKHKAWYKCIGPGTATDVESDKDLIGDYSGSKSNNYKRRDLSKEYEVVGVV